jgi:hypothetical protein
LNITIKKKAQMSNLSSESIALIVLASILVFLLLIILLWQCGAFKRKPRKIVEVEMEPKIVEVKILEKVKPRMNSESYSHFLR